MKALEGVATGKDTVVLANGTPVHCPHKCKMGERCWVYWDFTHNQAKTVEPREVPEENNFEYDEEENDFEFDYDLLNVYDEEWM